MEPRPTRRFVLLSAVSAAGGLIVGGHAAAAATTRAATRPPIQLGLYVRIEPTGKVVIGFPQTEMGQGIETALSMMVAEELDIDWSVVSVEQLPLMIRRTPDGKGFAFAGLAQGAGGSNSVIDAWPVMREAGARARRLLARAADQHWGLSAGACATEQGHARHPTSQQTLSYAVLAPIAAGLTDEPAAPPLKPRTAYRLLGQPIRNVRARDIVTGKPLFGIDASVPGMLHAVVLRAPQFDSRIAEVDDTATLAVAGVRQVVRLEGPLPEEPWAPIIASGVAVVATSHWAARKGRDALKVRWTESPHAAESSETLRAQMVELMKGRGHFVNDEGNVDGALAKADRLIERTYSLPFVAHATLEPQNCIASVEPDRVLIVAPTQSPGAASRLANALTGIDRMKVEVRMTRLGGGFGRRLETDMIGEAILISKAAGAPVKLIWTREDDLRHDFYRPACRQHLIAGLDAGQRIVAWNQRVASTPKNHRRTGDDGKTPWAADLYQMDFPGGLVANFRREYFAAQSGVPRRSWRAPGHWVNAFAVESFLDEIAHETGADPLELRLSILRAGPATIDWRDEGVVFDTVRMASALSAAAKAADWGAPLPSGAGRGIARHFTFGSYAASVVQVRVDAAGGLMIDKVTTALDCGFAVNPMGLRAQIEGGAGDALSVAIGQQITIEAGAVREGNFDRYDMLRMAGSPRRIEAVLVDNGHPPTGAGEPPTTPVAPALTNAIFAATGKRIRDLPVANQLRA